MMPSCEILVSRWAVRPADGFLCTRHTGHKCPLLRFLDPELPKQTPNKENATEALCGLLTPKTRARRLDSLGSTRQMRVHPPSGPSPQ